MSPECTASRAVISILLGRAPGDQACTDDQVDAAFHHLKRCGLCRAALTPGERAKFLSNAILQRE